MKVLVVGSGGREHAIAWALRRDGADVYALPGSAAIGGVARNLPFDPKDVRAVTAWAVGEKTDLVVIGPEAPLVEGLSDALRAGGLAVFGPSAAAARLEGSKAFAKEFMRAHGLPTADFRVFTGAAEAKAFVSSPEWPASFRIVKADGLAAGKGVLICKDRAETLAAIETVMVRREFGAAGDALVLEEALEGEELSVMALVDGKTILPLLTTQDHKRVFDNDQGPNTGGMGAYGPVPRASGAVGEKIEKEILAGFLRGIQKDKLDYRGVIYAGLMLTAQGPKILEFNVRFGDPETQVILPMGSDWPGLFLATAEGRLRPGAFRARAGAAVTVVLASGGYPGAFAKNKPITGLAEAAAEKDVLLFHAGTANGPDGGFITSGGRVLAVTGLGADIAAARDRAYAGVAKIRFEGAHHRTDIGNRALCRA